MIAFLTSLVFVLPFLVVAGIIMIISLETDKEGVASTFFSLGTALVIWSYGPEIWAFITENWLTTIYFSVGYIILGLIWSFLKWNQKVAKIFKLFSKLKAKFIDENGKITKENRYKFNQSLEYKFKDSESRYTLSSFGYENDPYSEEKVIKSITPKGLEHKAKIVSWIGYWPLSLIGTLLNDPFRRFFEWIYESVSGVYDKITAMQKNKYIQ